MARIRLYVQQSLRTTAETVVGRRGESLVVPFLRLFTVIKVGRRPRRLCDTIIDTGAPLTVFPQRAWRNFAAEVEWLDLPAARAAVSWVAKLRGKTGGERRCRVGRVRVEAFDLERPPSSLPAVNVVAQFEEEDSADDRILTGLFGGILEGRRLILEPDLRQAWLEER